MAANDILAQRFRAPRDPDVGTLGISLPPDARPALVTPIEDRDGTQPLIACVRVPLDRVTRGPMEDHALSAFGRASFADAAYVLDLEEGPS